jgi:hypothetical protein
LTAASTCFAVSTCIGISSSSLFGGLAGVQGVLCIICMVQAAAVLQRTPLASNILHPWLHFVIATIAAFCYRYRRRCISRPRPEFHLQPLQQKVRGGGSLKLIVHMQMPRDHWQ